MSSFVVTAAFTEEVTGLALSDFIVGNGTTGNLAGGPDIYSMTVTTLGSEAVTIFLPGGVVQDSELNGNYPSNLLEIP